MPATSRRFLLPSFFFFCVLLRKTISFDDEYFNQMESKKGRKEEGGRGGRRKEEAGRKGLEETGKEGGWKIDCSKMEKPAVIRKSKRKIEGEILNMVTRESRKRKKR